MTDPAPDDSLGFEAALQEIQEIVTDLEEGQLGLEESMQRFERGVSLLRRCYRIIHEAEQKIELLTGFTDLGEPEFEDFDSTATLEKKTPRKKTKPDDTTLF